MFRLQISTGPALVPGFEPFTSRFSGPSGLRFSDDLERSESLAILTYAPFPSTGGGGASTSRFCFSSARETQGRGACAWSRHIFEATRTIFYIKVSLVNINWLPPIDQKKIWVEASMGAKKAFTQQTFHLKN